MTYGDIARQVRLNQITHRLFWPVYQ
ncbi:hypothetical protein EKH83_18950 [Arcticibacter tournemirensis]|uniref:Uncharacterized protein n=1 Tax=Arcticibacter tournemirensis TaxID=699437 RepID=A0A4Q0M4M7_9SPHI|nr:hypothetical protein EKH83_18950 [Arcticibacter tournemirensis]